jgi:DNA transposition AAA+ family ATPase
MTTPDTQDTTHNETTAQGIDPSLLAEASSAHARINVPLNLSVWRDRPHDEQELLTWFHQHILDEGLNWDAASEAIGYERSVIFRLLRGTYQAESWAKPLSAIRSYRRIAIQRASIVRAEFRENATSRMIWAGLDYALANNSITTIIGESRQGKTVAARAWAEANNHGRSVYVVAPPVGGIKMLMRVIAQRVGANKNQSIVQLADSLHRAFNRNRILIVDEAHRLMPNDARTLNPANLELLRDLHDQTGCALALIATSRFSDRLRSGTYQFEQLIGRIGMPIRLPRNSGKGDIMPILEQYIPQPSPALLDELISIGNKPGRLGILSETLKVASRMAAKAKQPMSEDHVAKAIEIRRKMSGELATK